MLWEAVADLAIDKGDSLFVSVYKWNDEHPGLRNLEKKGVTVQRRRRSDQELTAIGKVAVKLQRRVNPVSEWEALIDFKPDHVLISQGDNFDIAVHHQYLAFSLIRAGIPFSLICHSHAQYSLIPGKNVYVTGADIFSKAKRVFFVSDRQRILTERRLAIKLPNAQITFNPVNLDRGCPPFPFPTGRINFSAVGNLTGGKGQDTLLHVLSQPQWRNRDWILNIYGKGEGLEYLEKLTKFFGLSENVVFHGHVSDIRAVWAVNHILVSASAGEGLPITLIEAMLCERPAVVADIGGMSDMIIESVTGYISEAPSLHSFSNAMERAWVDRSHWEERGKAAKVRIDTFDIADPEQKIYSVMQNQSLS